MLVVLLTILLPFSASCQTKKKQALKLEYDNILFGKGEPSLNQMVGYSKSNNSYNFMAIGYFFNANNLMYKSTNQIKYLESNMDVLENLIFDKRSRGNYMKNKWPISVAKSHMTANQNGLESLVYEGYFFRYLAEFYSIIKDNGLFKDRQVEILNTLKYSFDKWAVPSYEKFGDDSSFHHLRLHIGSHWATVAIYLFKYTNNQKYFSFYNKFNQQVRKAMKKKIVNGNTCFIWNSTYPEKFNVALKRNQTYKPVIQDVSHGNHVVQFILDSYKLGYGNWSKNDLQYLSNTVKYILWNPKTISFSDMVDGSKSTDKSFVNEGWKQSDGWMKLMFYDNSLIDLYLKFFHKNESKIVNKFQGLQAISVLYSAM